MMNSNMGVAGCTCGLVVVDVDAVELQVRGARVRSGRVDSVLVRDHLPELQKTQNIRGDLTNLHYHEEKMEVK